MTKTTRTTNAQGMDMGIHQHASKPRTVRFKDSSRGKKAELLES